MELRTIQEIAAILNEPRQRCSYMVLKHNIPHCRLAGRVRLFNDEQIAQIKAGCYAIEIRQDK